MQVFFNGLISGLSLALLAVAFQVIYLPTRVFFVTLAAIYSAAPFLAMAILHACGNWILAVFAAVVGSVALCLLCEWANHAPLSRHQASPNTHLIAALGAYICIVQVLAIVWGNDLKMLTDGIGPLTHFRGVLVTGSQWLTLCVAVVLLAAFAAILMQSNLGLRLRALADNPSQFAMLGFSIDAHRLMAFGLAGVLSAASSLVTAFDVGVEPHGGLHVFLLALVSVIIGGERSFFGPVVGSILVGLVREEVLWHLSARWQEAFTFVLLSGFLLLRPQGLFKRLERIEAATS